MGIRWTGRSIAVAAIVMAAAAWLYLLPMGKDSSVRAGERITKAKSEMLKRTG